MTIQEAITQLDTIKPNQYGEDQKIKWLSILDGMVKEEIINTHEGYMDKPFTGYTEETANTTLLLVPEPYSDMYLHYLSSQVDLNNSELIRYNNSAALFNERYTAYANYYNRTTLPLQPNSFKV